MPKTEFVVKLGWKYSTIYAPDGKTVYAELERTKSNDIICSCVNEKVFDGLHYQSAGTSNMKEAVEGALKFTRSHLMCYAKTPQ